MQERTEIVILLDFYGNLLSGKQLEAMESYYFEDLSLTEIACNNKVSKQAISNLLIRAENRLVEIEDELGLVEKSKKIRAELLALVNLLEDDQGQGKDKRIELAKNSLQNLANKF